MKTTEVEKEEGNGAEVVPTNLVLDSTEQSPPKTVERVLKLISDEVARETDSAKRKDLETEIELFRQTRGSLTLSAFQPFFSYFEGEKGNVQAVTHLLELTSYHQVLPTWDILARATDLASKAQHLGAVNSVLDGLDRLSAQGLFHLCTITELLH